MQVRLLKSQLEQRQKNGTDGLSPEEDGLENGMDSHLLDLQSESPHCHIAAPSYCIPCILTDLFALTNNVVHSAGDANRQISDLKFKLVKSEQEVTALEQNVSEMLASSFATSPFNIIIKHLVDCGVDYLGM